MPNFTYMAVNWVYMLSLCIWLGGMIAFVVLFAPSLTAVLSREDAGHVVANFLTRLRPTVVVCIVLLTITSVAKYGYWETVTPWLLMRWMALGIMAALAAYDFSVLAPKLVKSKATGDTTTFGKLHKTAVKTMGLTMLLGLIVLFLS